jgi:hypothetical protein
LEQSWVTGGQADPTHVMRRLESVFPEGAGARSQKQT